MKIPVKIKRIVSKVNYKNSKTESRDFSEEGCKLILVYFPIMTPRETIEIIPDTSK